MNIKSNQAVEREIQLTHTIVGAVYLPIEREQQGDGVFGHSVGRIGWHAHDIQAQFTSRRHIHVVATCAAQGEQLNTE